MTQRKACEYCGNRRRAVAHSNKHYHDSMVDGWRMGQPMLVCWKCEQDG